MRGVTEKQLNDYLRLRDTRGVRDRLLEGRIFRGTVYGVSVAASKTLVTIVRNGETTPDQTRYACTVPGYVPYAGDVIDLIWRSRSEAVVFQPVSLTVPTFPQLGQPGKVTASQGPFTADTDITGLLVNANVGTGRQIEIRVKVGASSTVVNDVVSFRIKEGATQLQSSEFDLLVAGSGRYVTFMVILSPTPGLHVYKVTGARFAGTGNITMAAGAAFPAVITVQDIGSA